MDNTDIQKSRIEELLRAFKIGYNEITATHGPTVTLFEIVPQYGTKFSKIRNLKDEFASALRVEGVRIITPLPNGNIGIEVPNLEREIVPINQMLYSPEYENCNYELPLVLGRKIDNSVFVADLATMPHLLVAGATGMGKSVGLNVILMSLLNKLTPDELKLVLIDPKQVELSVYNEIAKPYLAKLPTMTDAVITEVDDAKETLEAVIRLMESRYTLLKKNGVRNIQEYNRTTTERIPYYVVVIDEYGDLIMQAKGHEMEDAICRIAQKARAVGIHMIISTQRPDTKIVTGTIKANFPTRIAFRTTTGTDSRVVLGYNGAEKLNGKGDMLFFDGGGFTRMQCAYISTEQVNIFLHDMAEEYKESEQTTLPSPPTVEFHRRLLYNELREDTMRVIPTVVKMQKYYGYELRKIFPELAFSEIDVHLQMKEIGIVGEHDDVVIKDVNDAFQKAYQTYNA